MPSFSEVKDKDAEARSLMQIAAAVAQKAQADAASSPFVWNPRSISDVGRSTQGSCSVRRQYATAGIYDAVVTVRDDDLRSPEGTATDGTDVWIVDAAF